MEKIGNVYKIATFLTAQSEVRSRINRLQNLLEQEGWRLVKNDEGSLISIFQGTKIEGNVVIEYSRHEAYVFAVAPGLESLLSKYKQAEYI